jgi:predicted nucleotidyltransferase
MAKNKAFKYLTDKEIKAVIDLKREILKAYPEAKLILYGSKARGDFDEESDIDILVILPNLTNKIKDNIWTIALNVEEKYNFDVIFGVVVIDKEIFDKSPLFRGSLYYQAIKEEGISI